ncbi:MAG: PAS domain S-box protein [Saccharospirillum sp.]|nr:PAS domain S-box protein [Saccharospirillum sp.]
MMLSWETTQLSLIIQAYGLTLLILGVAALLTVRWYGKPEYSLQLGWLGFFGLLHGLYALIEGERLHHLDVRFEAPSSALFLTSALALLEFGRRLWNERSGGIQIRALPLYALLVSVAFSFAVFFTSAYFSLELTARYFMLFPGAVLAALGLNRRAKLAVQWPETRRLYFWLQVAAIAMLVYALTALVLSVQAGQVLSGPWPTREGFFERTGFHLEWVQALLSSSMAMALAVINQSRGNLTTRTLRRVTDNLQGFVYRCSNDRRWAVTFMSEGGEALTGYPAADFLSGQRHFGELIHPDDRQWVWQAVKAALHAREPFCLQYRIIDHKGDVHWCQDEGHGVFDTRGELRFLEGLVRNDDARHTAQSELQQERDFAKTLLDTAPVIILLLDDQGSIRYVNPFFESLTGYRLEEVEGKDWFDTFLPKRDQARIREHFTSSMNNRPVRGSVNPILTRTGEVRQIEWNEMLLQESGSRQSSMLGIGMDVTQRQQLEAQLRELNQSLEQRVEQRTSELEQATRRNMAVLETAIDGFFAISDEGVVLQTNEAFCRMLGYRQTEILGMHLSHIEAQETPEDIADHMNRVMQLGHDRFDTRHRTKSGAVLDVEISVSRVNLINDAIFYVFARDITERKAAEGRLKQALTCAERANKAKSEFLSRMSHELRTPLNAILGFSQLLQETDQNVERDQQSDYAHEIHQAGVHLLELVNEVLDLARIESGRLELALEPMLVASEIQQCVEQIELMARKRNIRIKVVDGQHFRVLADPLRFRQVVLNLLSNAVKYNQEGGRIELECSEQSTGWLRISVTDSGRGMSAEQQSRLFRPFERFVSPYEGIDGTGIGLSLCKYLVEAMNGRIGVCSTEGQGTTIWFELPLQKPGIDRATSNTDSEDDATLAEVRLPVSSGGLYRLLCIEDNPANLLLIQRAVKTRRDWVLDTAVTAKAGLTLAEQRVPDVILMDINLPDMSGYDALEALKRNDRLQSIPVIAITANAMPQDIERGRAAGFSDYITKPFKVRDLFTAIDALLNPAGGKP